VSKGAGAKVQVVEKIMIIKEGKEKLFIN